MLDVLVLVFQGGQGILTYEEDAEEELDVELNEEEPAFLAGQTTMAQTFSPIKVVKNPDGSMQRTCAKG
jgi:ATP-dependent RNA helicase DHX8/PRP22